MNKLLLILITLLVSINFVSAADDANIEITRASSNPSSVEPGNDVSLIIEVENIGDADAEDVFVKLDLSNVPFAPSSGTSSRNIGDLDEGDEDTTSFSLVADNDAVSGTYKIPVEVTYGYDKNIELTNGTDVTQTISKTTIGLVSITISGKPNLIVNVDNSYGIIGQKGNVDIQFTNRGRGDIKFLTVTLKDEFGYDILSNKQVYIGDVDSDDFETISFEIITFTDNPDLQLEVEYEDFEGTEYMQNHNIKLQTYTVSEAQALGLLPQDNTWIIAAVVGVIIIFFIIRKIRKKRKNHAV